MTYHCSECKRDVGPQLDKNGDPEPFLCAHTGRVAEPIQPIRRKPPQRVIPEDSLR